MKAKYVLHEFTLSWIEDLEIYAAGPIYDWQQTEAGKWCMDKAEDIHWVKETDQNTFGHRVKIIGTLTDKHATFWALKRA